MYPQQIIDALRHVRYPGNGKDLVEAGMLEDDIRISGLKVNFSIIFERDNDPFMRSLIKSAEQAVLTYVDSNAVVEINPKFHRQTASPAAESPLSDVKRIIAVSSGKGGVGKSTVACNLAVALAQQGHRVGLLDADIFGPSQPTMFGAEHERPVAETVDGRDLIVPIERYGVKLLSIGFFVDASSAVIWRGAMACNAVKQLINDACWGPLDYFLIDLPPGTSDIHLTLVQTLRLTGAIVVTTPQPVALADARRGIDMFRQDKIDVPVLGVIENMAWFTPAELPDNRYYIFGRDGGKELARQAGVPLLGQIPLVQSIRQGGDDGVPVAIQAGHPAAQFYEQIARQI
ncbi:MAG: Mrp/NBP35 family ATP-binding protein [Paludibacteraceae bacterium]|nr:Mrp/NBP35 family ATP-binding protein [Paludibacteraceae bacterium]